MKSSLKNARLIVPIPTSADHLLLSKPRQDTINARYKDILMQWLVWHFGSFVRQDMHFPLTGTLTRLATDALDASTLEQLLIPLREGVERWVHASIPLTDRGTNTIYWHYGQRLEASRYATAVELRLLELERS